MLQFWLYWQTSSVTSFRLDSNPEYSSFAPQLAADEMPEVTDVHLARALKDMSFWKAILAVIVFSNLQEMD